MAIPENLFLNPKSWAATRCSLYLQCSTAAESLSPPQKLSLRKMKNPLQEAPCPSSPKISPGSPCQKAPPPLLKSTIFLQIRSSYNRKRHPSLLQLLPKKKLSSSLSPKSQLSHTLLLLKRHPLTAACSFRDPPSLCNQPPGTSHSPGNLLPKLPKLLSPPKISLPDQHEKLSSLARDASPLTDSERPLPLFLAASQLALTASRFSQNHLYRCQPLIAPPTPLL